MTKAENPTMRIFAALGITIVVAGHLQADFLNIGGLFSYYAFHAYFFVFVAGFFYNPKSENNIVSFIVKKAKSLLVPYFIINLFYGIFCTILNLNGIYLGQSISLYNLFVAPFLGGHQFMFNSPAWYVPALFVIEIVYCISRKILSIILEKLRIEDEKALVIIDVLTFIVYLLLAMITIYLSTMGKTWGIYKTIGRWLLMLPGICFGRSFKEYGRKWVAKLVNLLKKNITKDSMFKAACAGLYIVFFAVICLIQYLVIINTEYGLNFSVVWATSYANGPIVPFITTFTGLSFWYGVSSLLAKTPLVKIFTYVGKSTNAIMSHHYLVVFVINSISLFVLNMTDESHLFDKGQYISDVTYQYPYLGTVLTPNINTVICVIVLTLYTVFSTKIKRNLSVKFKNKLW